MLNEKNKKIITILLTVSTEEELTTMSEESCWSPCVRQMIRERLEFLQERQV